MNYGSSQEETSEEEARAQDRRGEEDDGEKDGHCSSQDRQEALDFKRRGAPSPRLLYFPSKTISYRGAQGACSAPVATVCAHLRARRASARFSSCASALQARSTLDERRAWRGARLTIGGSAMRWLLRPLGRARQISVDEPARDAACERRRRARSCARVIRVFPKFFKLRRQQRPQSAPCE